MRRFRGAYRRPRLVDAGQPIDDLATRSGEPLQKSPLFQSSADDIDLLTRGNACAPREFIVVEIRPTLQCSGDQVGVSAGPNAAAVNRRLVLGFAAHW